MRYPYDRIYDRIANADPELVAQEDVLSERLKTKVKVVPVGKGGRVVINFIPRRNWKVSSATSQKTSGETPGLEACIKHKTAVKPLFFVGSECLVFIFFFTFFA